MLYQCSPFHQSSRFHVDEYDTNTYQENVSLRCGSILALTGGKPGFCGDCAANMFPLEHFV